MGGIHHPGPVKKDEQFLGSYCQSLALLDIVPSFSPSVTGYQNSSTGCGVLLSVFVADSS